MTNGLETHNRLRGLHKSQKLVLDDELTQNALDYAVHLAENQLWGHAPNLEDLNQGLETQIGHTLTVILCVV